VSRAGDLVEVLEDLGVEVNKVTGDEVQCRCPVHHKFKGRESTRYTFYLNTDSYLFHCFTCGARGSLYQLINELTDDPNQLWRIQSGMIQKGVSRLEPEEDVYEAPVTLDWLKYAEFDRLPQSVINFRNVDPDVALRHGVRWDSDIKAVLTPIVSPLGELRGYQQKYTRRTPCSASKERLTLSVSCWNLPSMSFGSTLCTEGESSAQCLPSVLTFHLTRLAY
jgi:hypothetical protein